MSRDCGLAFVAVVDAALLFATSSVVAVALIAIGRGDVDVLPKRFVVSAETSAKIFLINGDGAG